MNRLFFTTGWIGMGLILLHCSGWDRNNPLDPRNPVTRGRIINVDVTSLKHDVTVMWEPVQLDGMRRYHVHRKEAGQSAYERIGSVEKGEDTFSDPDRPYDVPVQYRVTAETESGYESPPSDSVTITPGPLTYWMLDYYDGSVTRLTHDGLHRLAFLREAIWPTAAAADTPGRSLWVVDYVTGYLIKISETGKILKWIGGLDHPTAIAYDALDHELWIVNRKRSEIMRFDTTGTALGTRTDVAEVRAIVWSGQRGECWISDPSLGKVGRIGQSGGWLASYPLRTSAGRGLDCFRADGSVWASDSLDMIRIDRDGNVLKTVRMTEPVYALSVNQTTGDCWAILNLDDDGNDAVVRVLPDGTVPVRVEGFRSAYSLAANPHHLGCFVADSGNGRLVMLGSDGRQTEEIIGLTSPWEIVNY